MPASKRPNEPSKIDARGRTVVPPEVREALGVSEGGFVVYEVKGSDVRIHKAEWSVPKR
ncbi:MAG TPA: AbrB/MazE/SpoVT family DNA-binding domain-containing protein [Candidatus Thermoplasmatota archaeon]|nr:AbrB/MazE/SpoVT family DNA-binding domain-containing protein [Candidatus Thermoplasmatota archaeon]